MRVRAALRRAVRAHVDEGTRLALSFACFLCLMSVGTPQAEERLLPLAANQRVAVLVNEPFENGGLFRLTRSAPLPPWAGDIGVQTWAQFFLKFVVSHPAVTCAIPATSKPRHLEDNMRAGLPPLPDEAQRARMRAHIRGL